MNLKTKLTIVIFKLSSIIYIRASQIMACSYNIILQHLFSRATNFMDFVDLGTFTKFVSPKVSGNSIVQTEEKTPMQIHESSFLGLPFLVHSQNLQPSKKVPYGSQLTIVEHVCTKASWLVMYKYGIWHERGYDNNLQSDNIVASYITTYGYNDFYRYPNYHMLPYQVKEYRSGIIDHRFFNLLFSLLSSQISLYHS